MGAFQSQLPPKPRLSQELRQALPLLASNPRGTTKDMLVVGHGLSADMLTMLVLAGLARVVTATLKAEGGTSRLSDYISRMPVGGRSKVDSSAYPLRSVERRSKVIERHQDDGRGIILAVAVLDPNSVRSGYLSEGRTR
jgi:hypothetical protein